MSTYFERYASRERLLTTPPDPQTRLIITVPAYREPHLLRLTESLKRCQPPSCHTEVLVLENYPQDEPPPVLFNPHGENLPHLTFHFMEQALPAKKAGVGLARKILMDEAAWRFTLLERDDGLIVGLDADCIVAPDYLQALWRFQRNQQEAGASISYEHPLEGPEDHSLYQAITEYELHLRYFIHARRWAGEWFAYQTVGSSMAVRSHAYQSVGGMNTRKAGEDFYFLQKIMPHGFYEIRDTRVFPSPRISHRVPFGTGRAMYEQLRRGEVRRSYHPLSFHILRSFFQAAPALYQGETFIPDPALSSFLTDSGGWQDIERIRVSSGSESAFLRHFHTWMDGFRTMKCLHYLREHGLPDLPVTEGAGWLLQTMGQPVPEDPLAQLKVFRELDGPAYPSWKASSL